MYFPAEERPQEQDDDREPTPEEEDSEEEENEARFIPKGHSADVMRLRAMLMSPPDTEATPPLIGDQSQLEAAQALTSPFRDGGLEILLRHLSSQID